MTQAMTLTFRRPARVPGTAMVFMHRFFARNSMVRNDPLVSILLALGHRRSDQRASMCFCTATPG